MKQIYKKKNSFLELSHKNNISPNFALDKIDKIDISNSRKFNDNQKKIFLTVKEELKKGNASEFSLTSNILDELNITDEEDWAKYLIHRYRYEVYPDKKILDDFPPYLQIEPSSICNYRCVFCFETDKTFTNKKNGFMGTMKSELFRDIIDDAKNNIEFISLASRGEPLVNPEFEKMIGYTEGKFLNLKINTNASLLNEKKCHSILSSGVKTLVFSADAAEEKLYSKLRVNGKLHKVLKNIEQFNHIKEKDYKNKKIITRVSGVKYSDEQDFKKMESFWKNLVNQVAFVDYNPWENIYVKEPNNLKTPCSDLWRRMFIWWDGKINPCDTDYKSNLKIRDYDGSISEAWKSEVYNNLRIAHLNQNRSNVKPCQSCNVI
tara:strand:+ start:5544 stop:6674 length:1131 start_codon:yes stop_codon:yes gene_type:complete